MGNIIEIRDKDGNYIGEINQSLLCYSYFTKIAGRYNPIFNKHDFIKDIDKELEPVYKKATPADEVVILLFMNDESNFTEEDIPSFEKAIKVYPKEFHEGPLRVLTKFTDLLKHHGQLTTKYKGVSVGMTVMRP